MKHKIRISPLIKELELRKPPVIIRVNKFTEDSAKKFSNEVAQAHNTGQEIIPVVIDSYGGQVYSLMAMIATIKNAELPIATIVEGKAMSCGAILFSFGADGHRYMDSHATIMIHDVSSMEMGKVEEIKASAEETERLNQLVYKMMAKNCGHTPKYFLNLVHEKGHADWFLDARDAKEHNLVNHLKVPTLNVDVDVKIKMK
jgi:ATP-dependent Clp protease protease subunit